MSAIPTGVLPTHVVGQTKSSFDNFVGEFFILFNMCTTDDGGNELAIFIRKATLQKPVCTVRKEKRPL